MWSRLLVVVSDHMIYVLIFGRLWATKILAWIKLPKVMWSDISQERQL